MITLKLLAATAAATLVLTMASAQAVTAEEYDQVQPGWTRAHVQRVFDDTGTRVVMWAGPRRRHLVKDYAGNDGTVYELTYVGPLTSAPFGPPYRVATKQITGGAL